jgi:hypothetical protein
MNEKYLLVIPEGTTKMRISMDDDKTMKEFVNLVRDDKLHFRTGNEILKNNNGHRCGW